MVNHIYEPTPYVNHYSASDNSHRGGDGGYKTD